MRGGGVGVEKAMDVEGGGLRRDPKNDAEGFPPRLGQIPGWASLHFGGTHNNMPPACAQGAPASKTVCGWCARARLGYHPSGAGARRSPPPPSLSANAASMGRLASPAQSLLEIRPTWGPAAALLAPSGSNLGIPAPLWLWKGLSRPFSTASPPCAPRETAQSASEHPLLSPRTHRPPGP